ncbi:hypothetical protein SAMN04488589_1183 [Methanolobus vulcani]|uniref:Uncharacterized protein n=1 Tax=Methanolobus vulcani TaxID=38026 RepID=A0A7Z7FC90_9EURY|nr:hypothetical protein [Methanolobus vulcani]SDF70649.1 hypothetical protein SAMN04488589_1183 [Methanolobus vulcani]
MSEVSLALIPSINKKTVIASFVTIGWSYIALIAATAIGIVSYHEVKYLFWGISLSLPICVLLMANPNSQNLNDKDEKKAIIAMIVTFAVFVIVALAAMLQGNI